MNWNRTIELSQQKMKQQKGNKKLGLKKKWFRFSSFHYLEVSFLVLKTESKKTHFFFGKDHMCLWPYDRLKHILCWRCAIKFWVKVAQPTLHKPAKMCGISNAPSKCERIENKAKQKRPANNETLNANNIKNKEWRRSGERERKKGILNGMFWKGANGISRKQIKIHFICWPSVICMSASP